MLDEHGVLQTAEGEIARVWRNHYVNLVADRTGNSRDPTAWDELRNGLPGREEDVWEELNADIEWKEIENTLRNHLKKNKAPGVDDIPIELFQSLLPGEDIDEQASLGREHLTKMLQTMFSTGRIPVVWTNTILFSIYKKGDPCDVSNYRGISLMDSVLKVLLALLAARIGRSLETRQGLSMSQAGFRRGEECVGQGIALYELLRRREILGEPTYLLFLDFMKAYDMVPHEALFVKLRHKGIKGRILSFIQALYATSNIRIRGPGGTLGEAFPLLRGLRQGCNLSPILFDIFIDDFFEGMEDDGIQVPYTTGKGTGADTAYFGPVPGLLFADDSALISPTPEALSRNLRKACEWAALNEMRYGVAKCGLMGVGVDGLEWATGPQWVIEGIPIPQVRDYTYLGFHLTDTLSWDDMVAERLKAGRKLAYRMKPFFQSSSIPPHTRIMVLKAVIIPKMLYGSEMWGCSRKRTDKVQLLVNWVLRWIIGAQGPITGTTVGGMFRELAVRPICATSSGNKVRAYFKFGECKTWIGKLVPYPLRKPKKTWVTQTHMWLAKEIGSHSGEIASRVDGRMEYPYEWADIDTVNEEGEPILRRSAKKAALYVANMIHRREDSIKLNILHPLSYSKHFDEYLTRDYKQLIVGKIKWKPSRGRGISLISQFRLQSYLTHSALVAMKIVIELVPQCPTCGAPTLETCRHILLSCVSYTDIRIKYVRPLLSEFRADIGEENKYAILLGGKTEGGECLTGYMENGVWKIASFLQKMHRVRTRLLRARNQELGILFQALATTNQGEEEQDIRHQAEAEEWT